MGRRNAGGRGDEHRLALQVIHEESPEGGAARRPRRALTPAIKAANGHGGVHAVRPNQKPTSNEQKSAC